jgi:ElaB/YqjD/DUF883 family membrane-anchored ribosome-binding protein
MEGVMADERGGESLKDQAAGVFQDALDKTSDGAADGAQKVTDAAIAGRDFVRDFVEDNPYSTVGIAFAIGLLIGYSAHRPPAKRTWWD